MEKLWMLEGLWVLFGIGAFITAFQWMRAVDARRDADYWHKRCLYTETDHLKKACANFYPQISVSEGHIDIPNVAPLLNIEASSEWDRSVLIFRDIWHMGSRSPMPNRWVRFWHRVLLGWRWESVTPNQSKEVTSQHV